MATYPPVSNVLKCSFQWTDGVGHFGSRMFFSGGTSPYAQNDLNSWTSSVAAAWGSNMAQDVSSMFKLTQVTTQDLSTAQGLLGLWTGSTSGGIAANPMPSNTSVNIHAKIATHYRGGHPTLHHPPPNASDLSNPRAWQGSYVTGVQTHWTAFIAAVFLLSNGSITGMNPVVLRGYHSGATSAQVVQWPVLNWQVSGRPGTVRHRLSTEA